MSHDETSTLLKQRRSRRQVLASLGLGAAALYVAPSLLSMDQAEARGKHRSKPSYSRPSYSRPSYSRPSYSRPSHSRPNHSRYHHSQSHHHRAQHSRPRHRYDQYARGYQSRPRWERDGVIELRISRLLPNRW
ncbi:MAG TPA: hypothetical protein ENI10_09570 [Halomonas sp.]|nr:hypothetical protein [Halomonas sp.]HDZ49165.1 hypothetical protein [Halomonas sp.]HEB04824.1 hypothetical protein [Halomonas sp.]